MSNFWVPKHKWQLVNCLLKLYPDTTKNKFNKMNKKQLYAIYFKARA